MMIKKVCVKGCFPILLDVDTDYEIIEGEIFDVMKNATKEMYFDSNDGEFMFEINSNVNQYIKDNFKLCDGLQEVLVKMSKADYEYFLNIKIKDLSLKVNGTYSEIKEIAKQRLEIV